MTIGRKEQNTESQEGKNFREQLCPRKEHLNGISHSHVLKENAENDIDKTVLALTKNEVLNEHRTTDQLKSDQPQEDEKHQNDIKRNNSVPNTPSDSQARPPTRNKNAICELDGTVSSKPCTTVQHIRDHEVAMGENNEQHWTRLEIEAQVDNNLTTHMPDNDATHDDDTTHHNSTSTPQMELSDSDSVTNIPPVPQIEEHSVSTIAVDEEKNNEMDENVCTTQTDVRPSSECEVSNNCDRTDNRKEDSLQPVQLEQNSNDFPPLTTVSPQQHLDAGVYASQRDSDKKSVESQPISSPPEQQLTDTDDQEEEDPLQSLSDFPPHCSQQLSDTSKVKDDPPQCYFDENPIDRLPHVVISSQEQFDAGDDSSISLPKPQDLAVDDGKGNRLKQLLSVENSLSDHLPEGDTVQHHLNENTNSPRTMISSHQQSDAGDQREGSSQHLLDEHSTTELSPIVSVSSEQQLDADSNCPAQSPLEGKSQVNSATSTQLKQQLYPAGQKEDPLQSASDINEHSPHTMTSSRWLDNGPCTCKDFLACTSLLSQPARLTRQKKHRKRRKRRRKNHRHGKVKHLKPHKRRLLSNHMSIQHYCKLGSPYPQPPKSKGPEPANRNDDNAPTNKGIGTNTEKQGSRSERRYLHGKRGCLFQPNAQQASSPGGNSNDGDGDKDGDRDPYSGGRSFHTQHNDPNWILLLLIVLLILCFCFPRPEDTPQQTPHTDKESVCSSGQYHTTSLDLKSSHFPDSSLDDLTPALFRGGIFSKHRQNVGEENTSSSTFPGGYSTDHLVSEEETPRFMGQGEEMAGLKKLHVKRRPRERPHATPPGSPRPQLDLNISEEVSPSQTSEPKLFTCPSPEDNSQEMSHNYDVSRHECTRLCDSVDEHMIFHSKCVFKSSKLTCGPTPNVRHILTDVNIHQHQQNPLLHYVTMLQNAESSNATQEREEDGEQLQEDDDPPSQFRGPGTVYKKSPGRSEGRSLDSGVGTNSIQNQVPTTQTPLVASAKIDISWRTSIKTDEIVYLTPNTEDGRRSTFPVILSVEEQTPRSLNYQHELVGAKQFNRKDNSINEPADTLSLQPPEPLLECLEWTPLLFEPSMKVFPYPSPSDEGSLDFQDVPEDLCVFVSGSTLYTHRNPSFPVVCSVLTDDTIGQSQQYPLLYFTTKI